MLVSSRGQTIQIKKIRHRKQDLAILYTLHSGGLRLGELLNLRCTDINRVGIKYLSALARVKMTGW